MAETPFSSILTSLFLILSFGYLSKSQQQCTSINGSEVRAGYWFSHSGHYSPMSTINTSLYTHLYYSYSLSLDESGRGTIAPTPDELPILGTFSTTMKSSNPSLKTLLTIATDEHQREASNAAFSAMAADPVLRASFISSALALARANSFDGLDLGWQLPASTADMANLATLLAEWRAQIKEEEHPLLLTASVYFANHLFDRSIDNLYYPVGAISRDMDWINVLSFGYHGGGNATTADAALFDRASHFSASYGITSWLDAGIPSCKVVMGIPLYGRSWILKNKEKNGLGAAVVAAGPRQKMSNQTGIMAFSEIEELLKEPSSVYVFDEKMATAYFHSGGLWVSFDSSQVVEKKLEFAVQSRLLGYFLWPISFDDSTHTVSREALEGWLKKNESQYIEGESGFQQYSPPPLGITPQDLAPTPSAVLSGSVQMFPVPTIPSFPWNMYLLMFFLLDFFFFIEM